MDENNNIKSVEDTYWDRFTLSHAPYDFTILGTKITRTVDDSDNLIETKEVVSQIRISPQLAKAMASILNGAIEAYEKNYGTIPDILNILPPTPQTKHE